MRPKCVKALSRRGLARVQLGDYSPAQSDILNALEYLPDDEVVERERIKAILVKAKKGLSEQNKALDKRKASMQKAFAAKEGGIGDSRVNEGRRRRPNPSDHEGDLVSPVRRNSPLWLGSVAVMLAVLLFYCLLLR